MAKSRFSFEKRRKELDKKKKKEAKRQAREERKAAGDQDDRDSVPIVEVDEFGIPVVSEEPEPEPGDPEQG